MNKSEESNEGCMPPEVLMNMIRDNDAYTGMKPVARGEVVGRPQKGEALIISISFVRQSRRLGLPGYQVSFLGHDLSKGHMDFLSTFTALA